MIQRGYSTQLILGGIGVILLLGLFLMGSGKWSVTPTKTDTPETVQTETEENTNTLQVPVAEGTTKNPSSGTASTPTKTPTPKPPVTTTPSTTTNPTAPIPPATTPGTGSSTETSTPPASAWTPGFQATTRVVPYVPSENERATLPACNGFVLSNNFINLANVTSIVEKPFSDSATLPELLSFIFQYKASDQRYGLTAPGDVYITYISEETGVSPDAVDMTIYFALCRDVIGYFTHVKELSPGMQRIADTSGCFGKPQSGPNACPMIVLEQVSTGSAFGNTGLLGGEFGFGLMDLRAERTLPPGAEYSVRTHYSHCPINYVEDQSALKQRLTSGTFCAP